MYLVISIYSKIHHMLSLNLTDEKENDLVERCEYNKTVLRHKAFVSIPTHTAVITSFMCSLVNLPILTNM